MPQVQASNSSSRVPAAPGSATKASASSAIRALRSCIDLHDLEPGQAGVRHLVVHQVLRDDADDLAAGGQRGVGDDAHQPDVPAAVDDADAGRRPGRGEVGRRLGVGRRAGVGPGEDGDAHGRSAAVVAVDRLGDADRLVAALALDHDGHRELQPAGDLLDVLQRRGQPDLEPTGTGEGKRTLFSP